MLRPLGDLRDDAVGVGLQRSVAVAVDRPGRSERSAGAGTSTKRFSWPSGATEGSTPLGLQTYSEAGSGHARASRRRSSRSSRASRRAKSSVWCSSWGSSPVDAEVHQQGARASGALAPSSSAEYVCRCSGSSWVSVWCRSAAETTMSASIVSPSSSRTPVRLLRRFVHEDARDGSGGADAHALVLRDGSDALDEAREPAHRVEHAVGHVEVAT